MVGYSNEEIFDYKKRFEAVCKEIVNHYQENEREYVAHFHEAIEDYGPFLAYGIMDQDLHELVFAYPGTYLAMGYEDPKTYTINVLMRLAARSIMTIMEIKGTEEE